MRTSKNATMEKTLKVKEAMANGKFNTIPDACEHFRLSPASYYNYAKKVKAGEKPYHLPETPTNATQWTSEIETLRKEVETLRLKLEQDRVITTRLKLKLAEAVIGM